MADETHASKRQSGYAGRGKGGGQDRSAARAKGHATRQNGSR